MCTEYTDSSSGVEQGFSFFMRVQDEYPKTEEGQRGQRTRFKAAAGRASSQWRAMSDAEKAVRAVILS